MRKAGVLASVVAALVMSVLPAQAQEQAVVPPARLVLQADTDLAATDLAQLFDTTLEACLTACLTNDACTALTFNSAKGACFPKTAVTGEVPFGGAISGYVVPTDPAVLSGAEVRQEAISALLRSEDFAAARQKALAVSAGFPASGASLSDLLDLARQSAQNRDYATAANWQAAAVAQSDAADQWVELARLSLEVPDGQGDRAEMASQALSAALNGYLRAPTKPGQTAALMVLADALKRAERGRESIGLLKLAQELTPRDDVAAALDQAIGEFGFRISETAADVEQVSPRVCATFTDELDPARVDYSPFVKMPRADLSVEPSGNQICIAGARHGERLELTFREGLPSKAGDTLVKDVTITQFLRDRAPGARFPGRTYVLPRLPDAGIPIETVNTDAVLLKLYRVSDRNITKAMQEGSFAQPLDYWQIEAFDGGTATEIWQGSAKVSREDNKDVQSRIALADLIGQPGPGVYVLQATVEGQVLDEFPPAAQWFVVSDLGLTTWLGTEGLDVTVRSLADTSAKAGAQVSLISRANEVLGVTATDDTGYAHFDAALTEGKGGAAPQLVQVTDGTGDMVFLPLNDSEFDLSDRGVEGRPAAPPVDVYLAPDRGAYRAGETVRATVLARDAKAEAIEGLPLTAILFRPDGVEYSRALAEPAGAGGYTVAMPVGGTAPRGTWTLEIYADTKAAALAGRRILVEDFLPERIDFALTLPEGPLRARDGFTVDLSARYLFGAPGADLGVEGELKLAPARAIEGYEGFLFGRHDAPMTPSFVTLDATTTGPDGSATLAVMGEDAASSFAQEARVTVRVREGSGRPVERNETRMILPETPVVGIKPVFSDGVVPEGDPARFQLIAVGPDAKPASAPVHWVVNKIEQDYQWYALYGSWSYEVVTRRTKVAEGDATLSPEGAVTVEAPVGWGEHEIVVSAGPASSSVSFAAGWWVSAGGASAPDRLPVSLDRADYAAGDTAKVRVTARAAGTALVAVLSNHLIHREVVALAEGDTVIDLPVTADWGAGAYVTVTALRPLAAANDSRAPVRALGLAYAKVAPGPRALTATIEAPKEADPRGPLPVSVRVEGIQPGEQAYVTVAAVDEGILNLTAFKSPDPLGHYFGQRKLGVGIRDLYGRLIDGQSGTLAEVRSGGDSGAGLKMQAPPPTEELVAYFSGPLTVGADGMAQTEFQMPSFNGSVKLMAIAWSKTGVGQDDETVLVRDPVVVTASVPRFLAPGDESRMLLEIVHATGPAGRMGLDITSDGLSLGNVASGVDLAEKGKATLSVPLKAGPAEGVETIRVALTTPEGKQLVKELKIPVQVNDPEIMRQSRFDLAAGDTFTLDENAFAGFVPGTAKATLAAGPIARLNAPGLLAALDAYPYGCTEQITSKALPLLYFEEIAAAMGATGAENIRTRVDEAITEVLSNQSANGAFGLWAPDSGDLWLDAFVTDFLSRAKAQGYAVPDLAFRNALDNLRNQVNYAEDFSGNGGPYAYALMVLAREGAAAVGDLRYYADVKPEVFDTPIAAAQLGAALAMYGDQTRADKLFAQAARLMAGDFATPEAQVWRADYGTNLRDATAVLALATEAGSTAIRPDTLGDAVATAMAGRQLSTQEASWGLLAAHALIAKPATEGFTLNGAPVEGPLIRVVDDQAVEPIAITNGSGKSSVVTLTTLGVPSDPVAAGGNGYAITRSYYTLEGEAVALDQVAQGTRLVAVVEVTPFDGGEARLIIDDPLPAGFEIDNPNLIAAGDVAALDWLETVQQPRMVEFRQERFLAQVDSTDGAPFRLAYLLRAISPGSFRHPAASVVDMYRPDYRAQTEAGRVTVTE